MENERENDVQVADAMVGVPGQANARLNITFGGMNGDMPDNVAFDATDADIKQMATEAVRTGYVPGIAASPDVNFTDYVVERFPANNKLPARVMLRPKTPFGA